MARTKREKDFPRDPNARWSTSINLRYGYFKALKLRAVKEDLSQERALELAMEKWAGDACMAEAFQPRGEKEGIEKSELAREIIQVAEETRKQASTLEVVDKPKAKRPRSN